MSAPLPDDGTGRRLLAALDDADPRTRDGDIARWCGVDPSLVAHWRSGARGIPAWCVGRILRRLPESARLAVAGELLAPSGLVVALAPEATTEGHALPIALDPAGWISRLSSEVHASEADGMWTDDEATAVHALLRAAEAQLAQVRARVRVGRVG